MSRRLERVAKRIQQELSRAIPTMKNPDIGFVTITQVEVSPDLGIAKVYVSFLPTRGHEEPEKSIAALQHSEGFLRAKLSPALRLRILPKLNFYLDQSIARGAEMESLIREARASDLKHSHSENGEESSEPGEDADNPEEDI
ncbi:MAG: 30S ribosome-binding factor RbfA [Planctomycetes bacterium]|nr:30S ribosome-binding factor RbfA [Planctomycetota bacterium]